MVLPIIHGINTYAKSDYKNAYKISHKQDCPVFAPCKNCKISLVGDLVLGFILLTFNRFADSYTSVFDGLTNNTWNQYIC